MSSPHLCMCGDDHVTCYMGAGGYIETEWGSRWDYLLSFIMIFFCIFLWFGFVITE